MAAPLKNPTTIVLTSCSPTLKTELNNIAENMGVQLGSFLKMELRKIVDNYPEKMRQPKLKD
jgi:hypothetical protein